MFGFIMCFPNLYTTFLTYYAISHFIKHMHCWTSMDSLVGYIITWSYKKKQEVNQAHNNTCPSPLTHRTQCTIENLDWLGGAGKLEKQVADLSNSISVSFLLLKYPTIPLKFSKAAKLHFMPDPEMWIVLLRILRIFNLSLQLLCATDTPPMIKKTHPTRLKIKP